MDLGISGVCYIQIMLKYLLLPTAKLCDGGGITATGLETARPLEVTDELITDPDTPNSSALEVEVSK